MRTFYDNTAKSYDKRHENDTTRHLRKRERELLRKCAKGRVIDVGCGTGIYAGLFDSYIGLDISRKMLLEASKKEKTTYVTGNAENLPFKDSSADTIICMFTVLNLCEHRKAAKEMKRVLKNNGILVVSAASVWDRKNYSFFRKLRKHHDSDIKNIRIEKHRMKFKLFAKKEITELFAKEGFELQEFHGVYKWQEPYWNKYMSFGIKERIKLLMESLLPSQTARIYIAIFRKAA